MLKYFVVIVSAHLFLLATVQAQNCPTDEKLVVCYYGSWAIYRPNVGYMNVSHIDPTLCTHLVYTFAGLDIIENRIVSLDPGNDFAANEGKDSYRMFVQLKQQNPCLKTILAIGGWNETPRKYSVMAKTPESRKEFAQSIVRYLTQYEFDGIDFDWEYPTQRGGISEDKANFISLLKEIKDQIKPWDFTLSVAVAVINDVVSQAYDIKQIADTVDFISLMAYDYTSPTSATTGLLAPLDSDNANQITIMKSVDLWIQGGAPANKLILGIPLYARSYKLKYPSKHGIGAETIQNTMSGKFTREIGFLSQYELAEIFLTFEYTIETNNKFQNNYAYNETYWISYDDTNTIQAKVKYALDKNLGGMMAWSIDTDDFNGLFSDDKYPLLRAINEGLGKIRTN